MPLLGLPLLASTVAVLMELPLPLPATAVVEQSVDRLVLVLPQPLLLLKIHLSWELPEPLVH